jgi:hypothetical protein
MISAVAFLALLASGASARTLTPVAPAPAAIDLTAVDAVYTTLFQSFKQAFGKDYADEREHTYRCVGFFFFFFFFF